MTPLKVLNKHWGYSSFRPLQLDIINALLAKNDVFALLPTGGGKSICFQVAALLQPGICIVVSPLVSLIENQVERLQELGIKAGYIKQRTSTNDIIQFFDNCKFNNFKFIYLSPERLKQNLIRQKLKELTINTLAVDEAHCISEWGHDFRPSYREIYTLKNEIEIPHTIALTATATPQVEKDIIANLQLKKPKVYKASFKRDNIFIDVKKVSHKESALIEIINHTEKSTIIYVSTRGETVRLKKLLTQTQQKIAIYHGGMSPTEKSKNSALWMQNHALVMVATTAFGMGIDKPDVRQIIHFNPPYSIENYYQEIGRAGRDGKKSRGILLIDSLSLSQLDEQLKTQLPQPKKLLFVYKKLCNYLQIAYGEGVDKKYPLNFKDFCATYKLSGKIVFQIFSILEQNGIIEIKNNWSYITQIFVKISPNTLVSFLDSNREAKNIMTPIMRSYGGIFEFPTSINIQKISHKTQIPYNKIIQVLKQLEQKNIIDLHLANVNLEIIFLTPREDQYTINSIARNVQLLQKNKIRKIETVTKFIEWQSCKSQFILSYFGEKKTPLCNHCNYCETLTKSQPHPKTNKKEVLSLLDIKPHYFEELRLNLQLDSISLTEILEILIEENNITRTDDMQYKISKHK